MPVVHRLARDDEKAPLEEALQKMDRFVRDYDDVSRRRRYFHLYKQRTVSNVVDDSLNQRITALGENLRDELLVASRVEPSDQMTHYGFLISYPGAPSQPWHVDYDGDQVVIYIPLTRETEQNATQYLSDRGGYRMMVQFISKAAEQVPIICTPRHSMHRGIENTEIFRRAVFYFIYSKPAWENPEPLFETATRLAITVDAVADYCEEE